ncbi:unnamed protein product, partial [Ixodes persulcatus]
PPPSPPSRRRTERPNRHTQKRARGAKKERKSASGSAHESERRRLKEARTLLGRAPSPSRSGRGASSSPPPGRVSLLPPFPALPAQKPPAAPVIRQGSPRRERSTRGAVSLSRASVTVAVAPRASAVAVECATLPSVCVDVCSYGVFGYSHRPVSG